MAAATSSICNKVSAAARSACSSLARVAKKLWTKACDFFRKAAAAARRAWSKVVRAVQRIRTKASAFFRNYVLQVAKAQFISEVADWLQPSLALAEIVLIVLYYFDVLGSLIPMVVIFRNFIFLINLIVSLILLIM